MRPSRCRSTSGLASPPLARRTIATPLSNLKLLACRAVRRNHEDDLLRKLLLAASVAVVVSAEEQAQCVKKTHDKAAAGVWAAKHFKTYLKDHPQVAL